MTIYVEYELRCDGHSGPYDCEPAIYALSENAAWAEARTAGWSREPTRNGEWKHYRPGHAPGDEPS